MMLERPPEFDLVLSAGRYALEKDHVQTNDVRTSDFRTSRRWQERLLGRCSN